MKWPQLRLVARVLSVIDVRDVFFIGGMAALCYGVSMIYLPAAWIVGGVVTVVLSIRGAN